MPKKQATLVDPANFWQYIVYYVVTNNESTLQDLWYYYKLRGAPKFVTDKIQKVTDLMQQTT